MNSSPRAMNARPLTIGVMPCLNEEQTLSQTCYSLGLGGGTEKPQLDTLIIVDNGSQDSSREIIQHIKKNSPPDVLILGEEKERGFIPARHTGCVKAQAVARMRGIPTERILILQMDADTIYQKDYVSSCVSAAGGMQNGMIEGISEMPQDFVDAYPDYVGLMKKIDADFESIMAPLQHDVIVDDKIASYYLSDYFRWGGHVREYAPDGEELHNGTSRLYVKAKMSGAQKVSAQNAVAYHSTRKLIRDPAASFATAGITRGESWKNRWRSYYRGTDDIVEFGTNTTDSEIQKAIISRRLHLFAIFSLLPSHVARALGKKIDVRMEKFLCELPLRTREDLLAHSGLAFFDVLQHIDTHPDTTYTQIKNLIAIQ